MWYLWMLAASYWHKIDTIKMAETEFSMSTISHPEYTICECIPVWNKAEVVLISCSPNKTFKNPEMG